MKPSSRSGARFFPPDLPEVLRTPQSFNILKRTLPSKHIADLIFKKCSELLKCKSSSHYSPVRTLSTTFTHPAPQPQKQMPYFGDPRSHIARKNRQFRTRECFQSWIHAISWRGWHDDVVDMMMWLTWWWVEDMMIGLTWWRGWHDGVDVENFRLMDDGHGEC